MAYIKHLLKHEYPLLEKVDYDKVIKFIRGKCSQYYFLDYMRCTNGNVDDAIKFYLLDDKLRVLFSQYLIRFEVQCKTDFVNSVQYQTNSSCFWKKRKYFIQEARQKGAKGKPSNFVRIKKRIATNIAKMSFNTMGPSNHVAMYSSSFGTFQELFKLIDIKFKDSFIEDYCKCLSIKSYRSLNGFFEAIRRIRNRCAHGNHIITIKMVNDLNSLRTLLTQQTLIRDRQCKLTVLESVILFLAGTLNCGQEFKSKITTLIAKNESILQKYKGKHSLSDKTLDKIA